MWGYKIYEALTSGLTHTLDRNVFNLGQSYIDLDSPRTFYEGMPHVDYNYGLVSFRDKNDQLYIRIDLKGPYNHSFETLELSLNDLKFNEDGVDYEDNYCEHLIAGERGNYIQFITHILRTLYW